MAPFPTPRPVSARLGLLDVMLTGDRPGIVTDFVTSTCPAGSATPPSSVKQLSDGPLVATDGRSRCASAVLTHTELVSDMRKELAHSC
jgi:hypothetical protein